MSGSFCAGALSGCLRQGGWKGGGREGENAGERAKGDGRQPAPHSEAVFNVPFAETRGAPRRRQEPDVPEEGHRDGDGGDETFQPFDERWGGGSPQFPERVQHQQLVQGLEEHRSTSAPPARESLL